MLSIALTERFHVDHAETTYDSSQWNLEQHCSLAGRHWFYLILPNTAKCNTCKYVNIYEVKPRNVWVLNIGGARTELLVVCLHVQLSPCWHAAVCDVPLTHQYRLSHHWDISHDINLRIWVQHLWSCSLVRSHLIVPCKRG